MEDTLVVNVGVGETVAVRLFVGVGVILIGSLT